MPGRRGVSVPVAGALLLIVVVGAGLRVWGMDYGLPHPTTRPDEERIVGRAFTILATGNFHPGDFTYPGLLKYLNALALAAYLAVGKLLGHYDKLWDFLFDVAVTSPGLQYRICRVVSVLCGLATVGATYLLARHAYGNRTTGLVAAAALATCYLHVRDSRFATVDVAMTLFVTLALLYAVKAAGQYRTSHFALAGLFGGLATATKYNGGLVMLGLVATCLPPLMIGRVPHPGKPAQSALLRKLALAAATTVVVFALAAPYTFLYPSAVLKALGEVSRLLYGGEGQRALWVHLGVTLPQGFGWPFFLAAVAGVMRSAWLRRPPDLVLLAFLVPFFATTAGVRWVFPRYLVPLAPVLAVLAAELSLYLLSRSRWRGGARAILALVALSGPGLWRSVEFDRLASRKDTRILASEWVEENLPRRSVILVCRGYGAPAINADRRRPPAFEPRMIGCRPEQVLEAGARYLVTHEHPSLTSYSTLRDDLRDLLSRRARPLVVFNPFVPDRRGEPNRPYFYGGDAFYLPFTGLGAMERGGPIITIWDLGDPSGSNG